METPPPPCGLVCTLRKKGPFSSYLAPIGESLWVPALCKKSKLLVSLNCAWSRTSHVWTVPGSGRARSELSLVQDESSLNCPWFRKSQVWIVPGSGRARSGKLYPCYCPVFLLSARKNGCGVRCLICRPVATGGGEGGSPLEKFEPPLGCLPWHFIGIGNEVYPPPLEFCQPPLLTIPGYGESYVLITFITCFLKKGKYDAKVTYDWMQEREKESH